MGYDLAAKISHQAHSSGATIREVARKMTKLSEDELDKLLDPYQMTEPGGSGASGS